MSRVCTTRAPTADGSTGNPNPRPPTVCAVRGRMAEGRQLLPADLRSLLQVIAWNPLNPAAARPTAVDDSGMAQSRTAFDRTLAASRVRMGRRCFGQALHANIGSVRIRSLCQLLIPPLKTLVPILLVESKRAPRSELARFLAVRHSQVTSVCTASFSRGRQARLRPVRASHTRAPGCSAARPPPGPPACCPPARVRDSLECAQLLLHRSNIDDQRAIFLVTALQKQHDPNTEIAGNRRVQAQVRAGAGSAWSARRGRPWVQFSSRLKAAGLAEGRYLPTRRSVTPEPARKPGPPLRRLAAAAAAPARPNT